MIRTRFVSVLAVGVSIALLGGMAAGQEEKYDEDKFGPEQLIVWQAPVPNVTFSHKAHTMRAGLDCDSCHDSLFQQEAGAVEKEGDFTMAAFAQGKYCGSCHNGNEAFDANSKQECLNCHIAPRSIVYTKPDKAVLFEHNRHVAMGMECAACHLDLFAMKVGTVEEKPQEFTMDALYKGKFCGSCHDGNEAFASNTRCTTCHIGVKGYQRMFGRPENHGGQDKAKH